MRTPILFAHHRSELGGAPASLSYLIERLDRERFEPHVYCPPGPAAELFRSAGATVHTGPVAGFTHIWASTYKGRRWLLFVRELLRLPMHLIAFRRVLRSRPFALVHLNDSPLLAAGLVARRRGIPIVWHLRSALPSRDDMRSRSLRRLIARVATVTIAINEDVAESFNIGSTVIPNSVDLDRFAPTDKGSAKRALHVSPDVLVVAYFGFIYPSKGFREFLEAASRLRREGLDAVYLVVGGAVRGDQFFSTVVGRGLQLLDLARNYEREARRLASELGVSDVVRFVPFTRDTAEIYQASDIVVSPSRGPELGRPVIEAAAAGVPVVASGSRSGGGVVVPDETAVLVPTGDLEALRAAVRLLADDPERRAAMGSSARAHAEVSFNPLRNAARVQEIYARILPARDARTPILFVHHRPQLGGAPVSLAQLISQFDERYEPHVLVPPGAAAELFAEAGAVVHPGRVAIFSHTWDNPYRSFRWLILLRELSALPEHLRVVRGLMREHRFPIVHLNDSPILAAPIVASRFGARVVWHLRSALAGDGRDGRSRIILGVINRWGDAAIAIDRDVARTFAVRIPLEIIHNSAATTPPELGQSGLRAELGLASDRVVVAFAGFIRRQKGWPELVRAARLLVDRGLPVQFVIIGGGVRPPSYFRTVRGRVLALFNVLRDEESAIHEMVASLGLDDHFVFLPFLSDTGAVYHAADIVTFPNQGVGLGRPVLEAAAYGRAVVASGSVDGGGVLVPGVTGMLVPEPTPTALADVLEQLVRDPELRTRLGLAAAEFAAANFDAARNAQRIEDLYDRLLGCERTDTADARAEYVSAAERGT